MTQASGRKTFVLIHGAWHGGWCWRRVADLLETGGHRVFAPTLTGLGERSHLLDKSVDLDTHISDIVNVFRWERLTDVCLVPHSYGGWPSSGALEHIYEQVTSLVWLDAFLPKDGQRGADFASGFSRKAFEESMARGEPARKPPPASAFLVNESDRAWVDAMLTPQPNAVATQPIRLTGARERIAKKTYIRATRYPQDSFDRALAECKADQPWRVIETATAGHDVMVDEPQWLADILIQAA